MSSKTPIQYGLSKGHTRYRARDFLDMDYLAKLSPQELEWLARFSREYYQVAFTQDSADLHAQGTQERRDLYNADNARRRDVWNNLRRVTRSYEHALEISKMAAQSGEDDE